MKNSFEINNLVRPNVFEMQAYSSARDEFEGDGNVFLDANENALGSAVLGNCHRYTDPKQWELKEKLAKIKGIKPDQIFFGNGSDEAIDLLFRAFCEPQKDRALVFPPTYGMYKVQANINNTPVDEIPLNSDFSLPVSKAEQVINPNTKLLFICSPNNPSGNLIAKPDIIRILESFKGLVIVDEAYIDFAEEGSMLPEIDNYPNLVVLQTFSKAWGMAALRLGMAFAQSKTIAILNKIKYPYNVNILTQEYACKAIDRIQQKNDMVSIIIKERTKLKSELEKISLIEHVYNSDANFLLTKVTQATQVYKELVKKGIIVRNRSNITLCTDCLRITVGSETENIELVKQIKDIAVNMETKASI
jgi:histidinol-phosphate aminotransferase